MRPLLAFSSASLYILMNWCCVSLIVAVPNFIVNSAAAAGPAARPQASARLPNSVHRDALRVLIIVPPLAGIFMARDPRWDGAPAQAPSGRRAKKMRFRPIAEVDSLAAVQSGDGTCGELARSPARSGRKT